jgi:hypothetical protein
MNSNINFRVFRRNNKNLILLWSSNMLSEDQKNSIKAFLTGEEGQPDRELLWKKFVPDNPEKFAADVDGMVVAHSSNGMDPAQACKIKVVFGSEPDLLDLEKEVLPANTPVQVPGTTAPAIKAYIYAWDYEKDEWVPFPASAIPAGTSVLIKTQEED